MPGIITPSGDPFDPGPGGFGPVPTIGGDVSTSVPDPVTGTSATQTQQASTATVQSLAQTVFLPPAPTWTPIADKTARLTLPWVTWFQVLNRKLGGYTSTPADDVQLLDDGPGYGGNARVLEALEALERSDIMPMERVRQIESMVQDALFLAEPGPAKDHLTTWNDWNLSISSAKVPAVNAPTWAAVVGNLNAYQFAVNDYLELQAQEFLHDWKEGSDLLLHIHWVTGGLNDATVRGVKWEVEYSVCNPLESAFGVSAFTSSTVVSAESTIPAAQPDRTHRISSIGTIAGTGFRIGSQIVMRLRRIAATGTAPAANPFAISFGLHYEADTAGSRTIFAK